MALMRAASADSPDDAGCGLDASEVHAINAKAAG